MKHTFVVLVAACFRAASTLTTYAYFMATGNGGGKRPGHSLDAVSRAAEGGKV